MNDLLLILGSLAAGAAVTYFLARFASRREGGPASPVASPTPKRRRLEAQEILEKMGEGVLLLDESLTPTYANTAARDMLGIQERGLPQRLPSEEIASVARRALRDDGAEQRISVWFPLPMTLQVRVATLKQGNGLLVVVHDVTEEAMAQRVRREFVAHASHELKSPVAGLETLAEALRTAVREDPDSAVKFAEQMRAESDRLGRLISDLLDLSKLEESMTAPEDPADLSTVARKTLAELQPAADAKELDLAASIADEVWVRGDEVQLGMMIQNLLENAIRYTPKFGSIRLRVLREDDRSYVSVSDTGAGIPRDAQPRIFERFYRVDRARSRDRGGTGLGLAIVKHVVELHGGRIDLESELGEGSIFSVYLPAIDRESRIDIDTSR
jgi:two-component system, OmpR family, phosphate regulon sensor histidine kinase PhoR